MLKIENVDVIGWEAAIGIQWETFQKYSRKKHSVL
jgi:hypothetical protein